MLYSSFSFFSEFEIESEVKATENSKIGQETVSVLRNYNAFHNNRP